MLISIEGVDCSGKTTLAKLLAEELKAEYIKFPNYESPTGEIISQYLSGKLQNLDTLIISSMFEIDKFILKDKLLSDNNIVVDRYILSGLVYSTFRFPELKRDYYISQLKSLIYDTFKLPVPNYTFIADISINQYIEIQKQKQFDIIEWDISNFNNYRKEFLKFKNKNIFILPYVSSVFR